MPQALLLIIAAIGISETSYLIRKRIMAEPPVCPIGQGCETVLNSKYNHLFFGIHNDILGMIFYVAFAFFIAFIAIGVEPLDLWVLFAKWSLLPATLMSLVLIYLQWWVIKAWCFWCIVSAITVGLMDLIIFTTELV